MLVKSVVTSNITRNFIGVNNLQPTRKVLERLSKLSHLNILDPVVVTQKARLKKDHMRGSKIGFHSGF